MVVGPLASNSGHAADHTWIAGVSADYGNGANWSSGMLPWNSHNIAIDVPLGDPGPADIERREFHRP
jgi:hypothetical protein